MDKTRFVIVPADVCNLTCSFCCVSACNGSSGTVMSKEDARKYATIIAKYLVKNNITNVEMPFYGGEPFLNIDAIKEFCHVLLDFHKTYGIPEMVHLAPMTNGTKNIPEYIDFVNSLNSDTDMFTTKIQFSFDGPKELCTETAEKTDISYMKNAIELSKANDSIDICCMMVISNQNMDNFFNIFKYIHTEGLLPYIVMRFDIINDDYDKFGSIVIPQYEQIVQYIKDNNVFLNDEHKLDFFRIYADDVPRGGCGSGIDTVCLSANGYLTGCMHDVVLISEHYPNRVYTKLTSVEDIENYMDLSFSQDWYDIGKEGHADCEDICPAHWEESKNNPARQNFFKRIHEITIAYFDKNEFINKMCKGCNTKIRYDIPLRYTMVNENEIVKQLDEGEVLNEDTKNTTDKHNIKDM